MRPASSPRARRTRGAIPGPMDSLSGAFSCAQSRRIGDLRQRARQDQGGGASRSRTRDHWPADWIMAPRFAPWIYADREAWARFNRAGAVLGNSGREPREVADMDDGHVDEIQQRPVRTGLPKDPSLFQFLGDFDQTVDFRHGLVSLSWLLQHQPRPSRVHRPARCGLGRACAAVIDKSKSCPANHYQTTISCSSNRMQPEQTHGASVSRDGSQRGWGFGKLTASGRGGRAAQ